MGCGMLRWAAFLRKLKPGRTFFQIWVVCQRNAEQAKMSRSTNCRRAAKSRHQRCRACPLESDPRSSLAQSVTLSTPSLSRSQPRCHGSSSSCPTGQVFIHSHSQHRRFPVKVTLWHLLDRTGREGSGPFGSTVSVSEPPVSDPVTFGAPVWSYPSAQ